ncbi:MAG TPA: PilC/PilY family type IV pilus protein [Sideroxyarcus sp.]|nr:PilC/PilY family type IV pilus protein [Sideroxyarcus sp.]
MKHQYRSTARIHLPLVALAASLCLPAPALAASIALATSPLATSTTSSVKPNVLLVLDNSGSMDWDHMPDDSSDGGSSVSFNYGFYGLRSSQCNQVYYDPATTYDPPVYADGTSYPSSSFAAAWTNGFNTGSGTLNLSTSFKASQSMNTDGTAQAAYYYTYSGSQTTLLQKNYHSTTNTFYKECNSAQNASPGQDVFTKVILTSNASTTATITVSGTSSTSVSGILVNGTLQIMSGTAAATTTPGTLATDIATQINLCTSAKSGNCTTTGGHGYTASVSGSTVTITGLADTASTLTVTRGNTGTMTFSPTINLAATAAQKTNFANWYSYYRTRLLMMKTATGRAFSHLNNSYRVGLMKISQTAPVVYSNTFETTHRSDWYSALYNMATSGSTPLRRSLSDAGRYYAGKLGGTDPVQYSCQQNFTILSTDGYWNTGDGYKIDGTTAVGNQDGTAARPMYDGSSASTTYTNTYTRNKYSSSGTKISGGSNCSGSKVRLLVQPEICSCTVTVAGTDCASACSSTNNTGWSNNGSKSYVSPYTSNSSSCVNSVTLPSPNPTARVLESSVASPATGGSSDNLADIAMYYYQTDLRTTALGNCTGALGLDVCLNNVFIGGNDHNLQQHMTTFTLGLGASGWMNYSSSYMSDTGGDYVNVKLGSTASSTVCTWQASGTVCNWPLPGMTGSDGLIANIDDLWHAAVNGRGAYFSATNPASLSSGLSNALSGINARRGAAAAAATSTLNPVAGNNFAFVASYTTVAWKGNLEARGINTDTGVVSENATWCVENVPAGTCAAPGVVTAETSGNTTTYNCVIPNAVLCTGGTMVGTDCHIPVATACTGTMNAKVSDLSDTRTIKTADSAGTGLVDFQYANLTATQQGYFSAAHISTLSQWSSLTATQKTVAAGDNLVKFLRGQYGYEDRTANVVDNRLFRYREAVLGDALESQPAFLSSPVFSYTYPGYASFKSAHANRAGTVYMGANDGMMHAFAGDTGIERWAYVPSMVMPNMWKLADMNYSTLHTNYVNGSAITSDVCVANCGDAATAVWKTILVAGLNGGGRGYYALDITNPNAPSLLWEFTPSTGMGVIQDDDLGYSFGQAIITSKNDGTWVVLVTSGYNNTSPGDGKGYLYVLDAGSGTIISKIGTGVGSTTTPSGLAKISGYNNDANGNLAGYVYGGDLQGNLWRFDINGSNAAAIGSGDVMKFATLFSDAAGTNPQPITSTPILGKIYGKRVIFIGTGKYLETSDLTTTQKQTMYAIQDDNETSTFVNPRNTLVQQTIIPDPNGAAFRIAGTSNSVDFTTGRGWYVDFPDSGERVNIEGKLVQGILIVASIVPSNTACSPGGYGWLNYFDYKTGTTTSEKFDATIVGINVIYVQGQPVVAVVTSDNPTPTQPDHDLPPITPPGFSGKRVLWRELMQ